MITLTHKAFTCITLILPNDLKKGKALPNNNGDHQKVPPLYKNVQDNEMSYFVTRYQITPNCTMLLIPFNFKFVLI